MTYTLKSLTDNLLSYTFPLLFVFRIMHYLLHYYSVYEWHINANIYRPQTTTYRRQFNPTFLGDTTTVPISIQLISFHFIIRNGIENVTLLLNKSRKVGWSVGRTILKIVTTQRAVARYATNWEESDLDWRPTNTTAVVVAEKKRQLKNMWL